MTHLSITPLEAWVAARIGAPADQGLPRQMLRDYQLAKLRDTLHVVKRRSPFYRRHLAAHAPEALQCLNDLGGWPLTSADDLRKDPLSFLCVSQSAVQRVVTLPTRLPEERPRRLFFSAGDLELAIDFFHHGFSKLVASGQRMLVMMPSRRPDSVGDLLARGLARLSVTAIAHGPMQSPEAVVDVALREHIDCMVGPPSEMICLVRYSGAARIPPGQIRSVWLGTENTRRSTVDEISRYWDCPVYQHYGVAELCPGGGAQCGARDGFHLREADVFIEIVDPRTGRPAPDGTAGEVVATTLTRQAMPLVRYRTGHLAAIMTAPCPCGSRLRRLTSILHRFAG
ncbi:MAG: DVU_1553 family AMP-dependent CoA ligase [Pseudomonadota bacterium]